MDDDDNLNPRAANIIIQIEQLRKSLRLALSRGWEGEYLCADLLEKVARLEAQLQDRVPWAGSTTPPPPPGSARDAARDAARDEEVAVLVQEKRSLWRQAEDLDSRLKAMALRLSDLWSENWALASECGDLADEVWRLKTHLRNSVALADVGIAQQSRRQPRTALERALEHRIWELESAGRNPGGRSRSRTM